MSKKETKPITKQLDELKQKIDWFYSDDFKIDEAIARYEEAISLSKQLEKQLKEMKNKVKEVAKDFSRE